MSSKHYEKAGWGTTLWNVIFDSNRYNEHSLVHDWVESQEKSYMEEDYDCERLHKLVWDMQNQQLIVFFDKIGLDIDKMTAGVWLYDSKNFTLKNWGADCDKEFDKSSIPIDRNVFKIWKRLANEEEYVLLDTLEISFLADFEKGRAVMCNERAWDDFNCFIDDVDKDSDQEVADFFGIEVDITRYKIANVEFDPSEVFICPNCGEANALKMLEDAWKVNEADEGDYYCDECGDIDVIGQKFVQANSHIPEWELVALRV